MSLLKPYCRYLLDAFDYDKTAYPGPPHALFYDDINALYGKNIKIIIILIMNTLFLLTKMLNEVRN